MKIFLSTSLLALTLTLVPGASFAASAPTEDTPVVTSVRVLNEEGGGLTPFLSSFCVIQVDATDDSPSALTGYQAVARDSADKVVGTATNPGATGDALTFKLPCAGLADGASYQVSVEEEGTGVSAPETFTYAVIRHPGGVSATSQVVDGVDGFTPGKQVTVSFRDGAWESGATFSTQVWVSATPQFTDADFTRNASGGDALVEKLDATAPVLTFTPPTTVAGKYLWYSVLAHKEGKADYRFTFSAVAVHPLPAQPKTWVKSFGRTSGIAEVGNLVRVSKVLLTPPGKKQHLKVRYQWFVDNGTTAVTGATNAAYTIPGSDKGQRLSVRVTVIDNDHASRSKVFKFGSVK